MKKSVVFILILFSIMMILSACNTDVVGRFAVTSFEKMQENAQVLRQNGQTIIASPTGNLFEYGPGGTAMKLPLAPFIEAGLDVNMLPDYIDIENDMLVIRQEYEAADMQAFVQQYRDKIGYHDVLDHYGIDMGNGNKFEWAKDIDKNDKDVVFVINPMPFQEAGVDAESVKGFVYAEVDIMGMKEFMLLSPHDL